MLGVTAALAAYQDGNPWLDDLMIYLQENRDFLKATWIAKCRKFA